MTLTHDAWLVDLDGTLYRSRPLKLAMLLELSLAGWRSVSTLRNFRQQHERLRGDSPSTEPTPSSSPYQRQLQLTAAAMGRPVSEVETTVQHWMQCKPQKWLARFRRQPLLDQVKAFRNAGGLTAVVSDYPAQYKLQALGCADLFDVVIANGEEGGPNFLKPHPEGYLKAAAQLGVAPERCLVIGDREDADGLAAERANMSFRRIQ